MKLLNPQLEVFMAVATNKSMHNAAKAIHLSQTAVTQRIRTLESRLSTTLFIRTKQGVHLTPDGEALLRYCYATQNLEGETLAKIRGAGNQYNIRISITGPSSIMSSRIIPQCLPIMKKFPHLLLNFDINDSAQRIKALQQGTHQFAIIEPEFCLKEMETKLLQSEKYLLVCTSKWRQRSHEDIIQSEKIIDFDERDLMTFNYLKSLKLFDLAQRERHFVNRTESLMRMLIEGYGYGVLTKEYAKAYIDNKQLIEIMPGKFYKNSLVLAWYERPEPPKYFSELIQVIK